MSYANNLLEAAKCIICLETYTEFTRAPILTACGHAFCRECVEKSAINHVFQCFECRKITLCGDGLKINISILQCLQAMNLLAPENDEMYAAALAKSLIVVDESQKLVDNITMALTEYVVTNGNELNDVDAAFGIIDEIARKDAVKVEEDGEIYLVEYHRDGTPYYTMIR